MSLVNEALKKAKIESGMRQVSREVDFGAITGGTTYGGHAGYGRAAGGINKYLIIGGVAALGVIAWPGIAYVYRATRPAEARAQTPIASAAPIAPVTPVTPVVETVVHEPVKSVQKKTQLIKPLIDIPAGGAAEANAPAPRAVEPAVTAAPVVAPVAAPDAATAPAPVVVAPVVEIAKPQAAPSNGLIEGRDYAKSVEIPNGPLLKLGGIACSDSIQLALLNGMTLEPGDSVDGVKVLKIEPKRVQLEYAGTKFFLRMP
ncbi:MAG: hypothetical protein GC162_13745 [Planctomycetes bacterium]|nr:hypothetical protein [Planctomycetota bacterium]